MDCSNSAPLRGRRRVEWHHCGCCTNGHDQTRTRERRQLATEIAALTAEPSYAKRMAIAHAATGVRGFTEAEWDTVEVPEGYRAEIIRGELVVTPSPARPHGTLQVQLALQLNPQLPADTEQLIGIEWLLGIPARVTGTPQPDLMIVPTGLPKIVAPPLLAVEVLSPSDFRHLERSPLTRIEGKRFDYAQGGLRDYLEFERGANSLWVRRYELVDRKLAVADERDEGVLEAARPFLYRIDIDALFSFP